MDELITLMWLWKQCLQDAAEQAWFMTCLLRFLANTNSGRCVGKDLVDLLIADWLSPNPLDPDSLDPDLLGPNPLGSDLLCSSMIPEGVVDLFHPHLHGCSQ